MAPDGCPAIRHKGGPTIRFGLGLVGGLPRGARFFIGADS
jgi:hypothetical protein